jgi:uncharacterized protein (TIGR00725 family)
MAVTSTPRRAIVGVIGSAACDPAAYAMARELGRRLAEAGYVVLCGGGSGVMEAAARGAGEAAGLTIGILPGRDAADSPPNPYVQVPLFTGISYARNYVNVVASDALVAVAGELGTLSEIALGLKCGKPVVLLDSWRFEIPGFADPPNLWRAADPADAVARVRALLGAPGAGGAAS